jgi:uncharacterized repeat protein (TIGR01451 family)
MKHPIQFIDQILFVRSAISRRRCRRGTLVLCSLTCLALLPVARAQGPLTSTSNTANGPGLDTKDRREKQQQEFLRQHTDATGRVRPDLWRKGVEQIMRMVVAPRVPVTPSGLIGGVWTQIGPAPLLKDSDPIKGYSGEVTDIAIDPRNTTDQVIYIATNDGGIWKSTDGGTSWTPKTDFMPSLSMGAVALDPSNPSIVYAGTGNFFNNGFFNAIGIYRSGDSGETWTSINPGNIFNNIGINRIVVPTPNTVLVGTNNGLYRSSNGGLSFGVPFFAGSFISDLKLDTASSLTVYAAVQRRGIFRSTDGGATFPASDNLFNNPGAPTAGTYFNVHFDQSTLLDNQTLYATVEFDSTTLKLFKSTNGGASWTQMMASGLSGFQFGYDDTVGVDPQDPSRLYIGLVLLFRSTDGGGSFTYVLGPVHPDFHAIALSPRSHFGGNPKTPVYVGNDGGIATSTNGGDNFKNINDRIATLLFRQIDIGRGSPANNAFTYGGMQDNAVAVRRAGFPPLEWHQNTAFLDGFGTAVDPSDPMKAYTSLNSGVNRTTDGGNNWLYNNVNGKFAFAVDPNNGMIVYAISTNPSSFFIPGPQLFRSTDSGVSFALIHTFPAAIQSIATVAIDSNTLWVGLTDGTVQRTSNALAGVNADWTGLTVTGALPQPVSGIAIDPSHTDQAVVVYQGFCGIFCAPGNRTRRVFRTTDNGVTWTDISGTDGGGGNLPDLPLHSVVIHSSALSYTIIVASDASVLRTANFGSTWEVLGVGFPMVDATSLALDAAVSPPLLRVGTYGRSVFELTGAIEIPDADLSITKTDFPDPVTAGNNLTYTIIVTNNGPATATSVTVTDNLPAETTFVSCSSTGGGVCGGSDNNRTVTFASLASGESETITFVATVNCSVADGTIISNTATVSSSTNDPNPNNNSATATTTASNPPPTITGVSANPSVLWPPNHRLVNVTVSYEVTDNCPLPPNSCTLSVTSNEPINGTGDGDTSPDWIILDAHHVLLRAERAGNGNGRIYTITITCIDSGGNSSSEQVEVTVPHDRGRR